MARRSPLNARYQKDTGPAGRTRRSASAAKPKRELGGQGTASAKKKSSRPSLRDAFKPTVPDTPEIKRWARIRWVLFGLAVLVALLAFALPAIRTNATATYGLIILYTFLIGGGILIDTTVIRKLRDAEKAKAKASEKKK